MRLKFLVSAAPLLAVSMLAATAVTSCAHPADYYDTGHNDRHRWDSREDVAYRRWEAERRYDHIAFERRSAEEQRAYWDWRHLNP